MWIMADEIFSFKAVPPFGFKLQSAFINCYIMVTLDKGNMFAMVSINMIDCDPNTGFFYNGDLKMQLQN